MRTRFDIDPADYAHRRLTELYEAPLREVRGEVEALRARVVALEAEVATLKAATGAVEHFMAFWRALVKPAA